MEEALAHGRVMAVAHDVDHVPAIVAQVLDGLLPDEVPLVGEEDHEDEDEHADDRADHPALQAALPGLERLRGARKRHAAATLAALH